MECRRCRERGKTWTGSDPVCGFDEDGNFRRENFACATLSALRQLVDSPVWHEDNYVGILKGPDFDPFGRGPVFVVLRWYKHRGRTDEVLWWGQGKPTSITLEQAELILEPKRTLH